MFSAQITRIHMFSFFFIVAKAFNIGTALSTNF